MSGPRDPVRFACPLPSAANDRVVLGHGSGGKLTADLIGSIFLPALQNPVLAKLNDQAVIGVNGARLAFTTDTFVVKPLVFPGGDIGSLAVHGTINDLAVGGARPLCLSAAFVIEEGFSLELLRRLVNSLAAAAEAAGTPVVTGDTKVVERGGCDGLFITTSGIGVLDDGVDLSCEYARPGDRILLSGSIGDHGIAVLGEREGFDFESAVRSDSAALHTLTAAMLRASAPHRAGDAAPGPIRTMRDPTRGGVASALNEIAGKAGVGVELEETAILVREEVRGACELLGLDPLYVANEGKLVAIVAPAAAAAVLRAMQGHPLGREARDIGCMTDEHPGVVTMRTTLGTRRLVEMLSGDQLPRIC
jgi:hydrogenase expression/formation protein HypE